ncbi:MAG: hypothetical protein JJLCMIEE_02759 [Acidimicrobiales bacterium]|nr:MAG: hypothetical protein EDR02_14660 [Actinomycetota bacterium]MBV6509663.1 hypothetical protein [Acidimicrobiales bacterium]RIK06353.1 MAG: hypothetical protein DCC48_07985 [Acidobacteriota bacterium]
MSESNQFGDDDNPFGGMQFFIGDLAKMLEQQGPMSWDAARQLALNIATEGKPEANIEPVERMKVEQLARVAELQVADVTGLSTSVAGAGVGIAPVNRSQWVTASLDAYRPLFEKLSSSLAGVMESQLEELDEADISDPAGALGSDPMGLLGNIMKMLGPMMLGMTAGSMVGHLATRVFGQYDLPIPRPPSDELMVVVANLDPFGEEWSLPPDDLRLWVCIHEITHHALLGVPHVRQRLEDLVSSYVSGFTSDPSGLEERLGDINPMDPTSIQGLQEAMGDPEVLLGAIQSDEQRALVPQLDALLMAIGGYVDWVLDNVGERLLASYGMVTEALRRRRVETDASSRFVERLFGLELTQEKFDRGSAFVEGVIERAGTDGLALLWESAENLPTPAEIDAAGLWLARIGAADGLPELDEAPDIPDTPDFGDD